MDKQDVVARYPKEISDFYLQSGKFPDNFKFEEGFACMLEGEKYFIHCRVVLPLRAFDKGVGFGLWVEVTKEEFEDYVTIEEDDVRYLKFQVLGKLANQWPGFENMIGARVMVRAVSVEEKVYITEILDVNDPLLQTAILIDSGDEIKIAEMEKMVQSYVVDQANNAQEKAVE